MSDKIVKKPAKSAAISSGLGLVNKKPGALGRLKTAAMQSETYREALFLVIDYSSSMACIDMGGRRIDAVKKAVDGLLDKSNSAISRMAVSKFSDVSFIVCPLTNQYSMVREAMLAIQPHGGTCISPALKMSADVLMLQEVAVRRMIVLSDGDAWDADEAIRWAIASRDSYRLPIIDTIYFNSQESGKDLMMKLAEISGGKFYYAADVSQLASAFKQLDVKSRGLLTAG